MTTRSRPSTYGAVAVVAGFARMTGTSRTSGAESSRTERSYGGLSGSALRPLVCQ
ncbi:hypothetical protein GTW40_28580 [Streptomyces sp. SID4985]|uniref:hypothetical protein n=1 Tax=Streptomyces sp. SID4985 TaxID=2690292 RepID=UPI001371DE65|nr:hypothetical protein [Streptomyces sp. SID4985]MYQ48936.1 hypothetical protein [Streptomyces sp. SID4985]